VFVQTKYRNVELGNPRICSYYMACLRIHRIIRIKIHPSLIA
jgi:hypothetical protein